MYEIKGGSADELFVQAADLIVKEGQEVGPRGMMTKEVMGVLLILTDPSKAVVELPERSISRKYLKAELDWYLSGSLDAKDIIPHAKFWATLADENGKVASNYGYLALHQQFHGKSQLEWCIERLKEDPDGDGASIFYLQPDIHSPDDKDYPCTLRQDFLLRQGKVHSTAVMRSNDLIWGTTYDMPWFTYLQQRVAEALQADLGMYHHFATSLHVYERHYPMLERIAKARWRFPTLPGPLLLGP